MMLSVRFSGRSGATPRGKFMCPNLDLRPSDDTQWKKYEELGVNPKLIDALRQNLSGRSVKTLRAYLADWSRFSAWCEAMELAPEPPDAKIVAYYLVSCAVGHESVGGKPVAIATIERRYVALHWKFGENGFPLGQTKYLKDVLTGIRSQQIKKEEEKEPARQLYTMELPTFKRFTKKRAKNILDLSVKIRPSKSQKAREGEGEPSINLSKALGL